MNSAKFIGFSLVRQCRSEDGRNRAHGNLLDSRRGMLHELTSCGSETAKSEDPEFAKLRAGGLPHQTARHRFSRYLPQQ